MSSVIPVRTNMPWLEARTILLVQHGSHAYGTNLPTSDTDYKGVAVPPREYFLGFSQKFEQAESKEPDLVIYDIRKFFQLARDCNPNIIEVLWGERVDDVILTPEGRLLVDNRDLFLSKKARHTFSGYALAQLKRINVHYRWLTNPPKVMPLRESFGLRPENEMTPAQRDQMGAAMAMVIREVATWHDLEWTELDEPGRIALRNRLTDYLARVGVSQDTLFVNAARSIGLDDNLIDILRREKDYRAVKQEWDSYQTWLKTRNPARAEIEARWGYDTKHASHLVRLLRMCREILTTGKVVVKRPDKDELLAIRNGAWKYGDLVMWAAQQDMEMDELYKTSKLQNAPNQKKLDDLCIQIVARMI